MNRKILWVWGVWALALAVGQGNAEAQAPSADRKSHWGVVANVAPTWKVPAAFNGVPFDSERVNVGGRDFEIGFVRGRDLGGDWGVSLVRKKFKNGSVLDNTRLDCFGETCLLGGVRLTMHKTSLLGVAVHKFVPFATFKRRGQIGMNFAGGIASVRGQAERRDFRSRFVTDSSGFTTAIVQNESTRQIEARELFLGGLKYMPLMKIEIAAAFIVAPGWKVRVGGGLNFPSYPGLNVSVSYLFGAK